MPFEPQIVSLAEVGPLEPYRWHLTETLTLSRPAVRNRPADEFTIPASFLPFKTDLASVPRFLTWLFPRYGLYTKAVVIHDYLCSTANPKVGEPDDRFRADEVMRDAMKELEVGWFRRWVMWAGVTWATVLTAMLRGWWRLAASALLMLGLVITLSTTVWHRSPLALVPPESLTDLVRYGIVDARVEWWWGLSRTVFVAVPWTLAACLLLHPSIRLARKFLAVSVLTVLGMPFLLIGVATQIVLFGFWILEVIVQPRLLTRLWRRKALVVRPMIQRGSDPGPDAVPEMTPKERRTRQVLRA